MTGVVARCVLIIADLQKDWEQGAEELAKILRSNNTLGGTIQSVNNEMSKGAQSISPVDNQKDELYAILRKRLFMHIAITEKEKAGVADAYIAELSKASAILECPTVKIREEILVSYPFHFSTEHLIASFNDNPGFQKTRDVIRLMAVIVRGLWAKGDAEVQRHSLLSLETADLNDPTVSSRFIEIKRSLQDALQTDIANNGTSHAESVDDDSTGLATRCAKWIYTASLSDIHPKGLTIEELAEYLLAPGQSIIGMPEALKKLYDTCWYIEQTKSGRYLFNRHKNLNAQVNSYVKSCTYADRDAEIEKKLTEMFGPRDKRCYQRLAVLPALDEVQRSRERLEAAGKLIKIEMVPFGDGQPILASHAMKQAFELAAEFAQTLHKRAKAAGFIKTLLQRRVGSSLEAGLKTAKKMLAGRELDEDTETEAEGESIYPLTEPEKEILRHLEQHLTRHLERESDPKCERVLDVLRSDFEGQTWLERGVLIFTQYYDSAYALATYLAEHVGQSIGLYTNSSATKLFEDQKVQSIKRELLKEKVTQGRLKLLIGTDAASTGLNLQRLGCLINLDLPWNPTLLEQRKGRVQRGTIAKRIPFYNMRYDSGAEQQLFDVLSGRIQEITAIFGTVPDFIVDLWVDDMLENKSWDDQVLLTVINDQRQNPFVVKETTESLEADWEESQQHRCVSRALGSLEIERSALSFSN